MYYIKILDNYLSDEGLTEISKKVRYLPKLAKINLGSIIL